MSPVQPSFQSAVADFHRARQQAALQSILARLRGQPVELLSYDDVYQKLRPTGRADRGVRDIPVNAIVGSVGRYTDFTRTFLPRHRSDEQRWAKVKTAIDERSMGALPPIEVYQIGEAYFVKDGNHRVSIARREGIEFIAAYVTEVRTRVPLTPDALREPDELISKAEYAAFLERTRLDELHPGADLSVSVPGQYARLEDHIEAYRYLKETEQARDLTYDEAVCAWHDDVYLPVVQAVREQGLLRYFTQRTEADFYLWIADHQIDLQHELGWSVRPESLAAKLAAQISIQPERSARQILDHGLLDVSKIRRETGAWRREKIVDRYGDRLFADILAPLSGEPESWSALDQALDIARREGANVYGLHVVESDADERGEGARSLQAEFQRRCEAAGVAGQIGTEAGEVTPHIIERSVMADLIILHLAHPPASQRLTRLGSNIRAIIQRCPRPALFVPQAASPLSRALLAYDGSTKAREALFVAAYFAERFKTSLVIVSVMDGRVTPEALDYARRYLDLHEARAEFIQATGSVAEAVLTTVDESDADLIMMGGYSRSGVMQVMLGSSVEQVLRESKRPVLVCR